MTTFILTKCLWMRAKKEHLCQENLLEETYLLIAFLQLLIHIDKETRKDFFEDIKTCFVNKNKLFKDFLSYFEKTGSQTLL